MEAGAACAVIAKWPASFGSSAYLVRQQRLTNALPIVRWPTAENVSFLLNVFSSAFRSWTVRGAPKIATFVSVPYPPNAMYFEVEHRMDE